MSRAWNEIFSCSAHECRPVVSWRELEKVGVSKSPEEVMALPREPLPEGDPLRRWSRVWHCGRFLELSKFQMFVWNCPIFKCWQQIHIRKKQTSKQTKWSKKSFTCVKQNQPVRQVQLAGLQIAISVWLLWKIPIFKKKEKLHDHNFLFEKSLLS